MQYNAVSQTGLRTSKQLHALYDFLKKAERSALSGPEQVIMISMMTGLFSIAFDLKTCSILCKVIPHYLMLFSLKDVCLKYKIQMILQMYLILMQNKPRIIIYKFFHWISFISEVPCSFKGWPMWVITWVTVSRSDLVPYTLNGGYFLPASMFMSQAGSIHKSKLFITFLHRAGRGSSHESWITIFWGNTLEYNRK